MTDDKRDRHVQKFAEDTRQKIDQVANRIQPIAGEEIWEADAVAPEHAQKHQACDQHKQKEQNRCHRLRPCLLRTAHSGLINENHSPLDVMPP